VIIEVRVIPNAGRTEFSGVRDGKPVLRVGAPARDGKANKAVVAYLAQYCAVPKSSVRMVAGEKGRHKKIEILGLDSGREDVLRAGLLTNNSLSRK
jgi:hypothetical protein